MKNKELSRRIVSKKHDFELSVHHYFNCFIAEPFILGKKVLDLGCWTGNLSNLLNKSAQTVAGVDPGKSALELASAKFPDVKFLIGDATNIPFENNAFDVVTFFEVLEHLPVNSEIQALREIRRVLKETGVLILSTPNKSIISVLGDPAYFLIGHRHYSLDKLTSLLSKSGFRIIKIYQTGGLMRIFTVNIELLAKHLFGTKIAFPKFINNLVVDEYRSGGYFENHIVAEKLPK